MEEGSRTHRTIQNARVSLFFFILQIFLGFYSRKIFFNYLGAEILGLNTTLGNLLGFLNLAEMGIGVAIATSLYRPILQKNQQEISEILSVQSILYKRLVLFLLVLSIPLMGIFPMLFEKTNCSLSYIYIAYLVFLWGTISGYMWNYKEIVIAADQKGYKLMYYVQGGKLIKTVFQIILLLNGGEYWGWISVEFGFSCILVFIINYVIKREYPWLKIHHKAGKELLSRYQDLIKQTKQLFFHKISTYVLYETSPLIIYAYASLSMVAYYGNYMILINYTMSMVNVVFEGMGASIGNLVAENNKTHTMEVFWELFTSRIWLAAVCCFALYVSIPSFIILWIGKEYLLENITLILLILSLFIKISRSVIDSFKNAYKLFADVWAPVSEAALNLSFSLLLGYFWGINGILTGVNISLVIVVLLWKPYYVFKKGFYTSVKEYAKKYVLHIAMLIICVVISLKIIEQLGFSPVNSYLFLAIYSVCSTLIFAAISYVVLYFTTSGMKRFSKRLLNLINH